MMQKARDESDGARVRRGGVEEEEGAELGEFLKFFNFHFFFSFFTNLYQNLFQAKLKFFENFQEKSLNFHFKNKI